MNFDLPLARQALEFSARAYDEASFKKRETSTEGLVLSRDGDPTDLIVAFRGSKEPLDFINDARFIIKDKWFGSHAARVHRGFSRNYYSAIDDVREAVKDATRIVCTGHSKGGAEAMLTALFLKESDYPITDVITFGCPRVGNGAFRDYYNGVLGHDTIRFEAEGDPVPWTPPWLLNGYRHVGHAVYLKNDGRVIEDPNLFDHVPAFAAKVRVNVSSPETVKELFGIFDPHFIRNYQRLFAQLKEAA